MVFKDFEESLMIFGESSKIVIFMTVITNEAHDDRTLHKDHRKTVT